MISSWSKLLLSWLGRVNALKMTAFPQLLYLFRVLEHLQKAFNRFVWDNKKVRLSFAVASRNRHKGGLGIPKLQCYYIAAQLSQLAAWNGGDIAQAWASIEQEIINVKNVLWSKSLIMRNQTNPIISHSLKLWWRFGTKHKMISPSNPAQSFFGPDFDPGNFS